MAHTSLFRTFSILLIYTAHDQVCASCIILPYTAFVCMFCVILAYTAQGNLCTFCIILFDIAFLSILRYVGL